MGVFSETGELEAIEGLTTDITPQKHAELSLQKARAELEQRVEERTAELTKTNERLQAEVEQRRQAEADLTIFQRFVESSTQGFGMADLNGQIVYVNPFLARLYDAKAPDDVIGTHLSTYYPADYLAKRDREIIPALRHGHHWQGEQMLIFPDGQMHPTIHAVFPVLDDEGKLLCTAAVITDITDLKRTEASLRQSYEDLRRSEERFELVVQGAGVGIWDWDIGTGKVYYSPRWKMLFGYGENEIGEGVEDWARLLHPDDREWVIKFQDDFLAGTEANVTAEYRLRHKDGSYRWISAHALVVRDEQGKACRLVGSHSDITDRKEAQERVKAEQDALRRMLQASDHDRELVTYEIHDGIAQRLAAASMYLEAVSKMVHRIEELRADFDAGLGALREASAEARSLMNRTRTPVLNKFGLKAAIADFIDQFSDRPNAPEITYHCEAQFVRLEPVLENTIFRVAQEAITNACIHSKSEIVRVTLIQDDEQVTLGVEDNGIGFDVGHGKEGRFGLDSIRERVRLLGKHLKLDSKPGQGTRIEATFPLIYRKEEN
jgi:two-component system sensor histidine kinase UhpB